MKNLSIFLLLQLCLIFSIKAQEINFDVIHNSKNAGFIKITKIKDNKVDKYKFESDFTMNKGIDIQIQEKITTSFLNDTMIESKIKSDLNGSNRFNISQTYDKGKKILTRSINNKPKDETVEPFNFTYIRLFFEAPKTNNDIYSELYNLLFKVAISKNIVTVTDNRNRIQKFVYDTNGNLEKAYLSNSIDNYEVVIKK